MGYRAPISTNPAMVLGGLEEGVTPLEWTYAYTTLANDGERVSGSLAPVPGDSPVAYTQVTDQDGNTIKGGDNDSMREQVISEETAQTAKSILETVVSSGTGVSANIGAAGQWGKTGTTEENGDAWFCGATEEVTACVWVGYADSVTPMTTLFNGGPVMGGTFPALIWASVIGAWEEIAAERAAERAARKAGKDDGSDSDSDSEGEAEIYVPPSTETEEVAPEEVAPGRSRPGTGSHARSGARRSSPARRNRRWRGYYGRLSRGFRDVGRAGEAEAPGEIDRFRDADPGAGEDLGRPGGGSRRQQERIAGEIGAVRIQPDSQRLGQPPRARAELAVGPAAAPGAHLLDPMGRLEGADQDRGRLALRFGDRVEQAVDAVGEVDVGAPRRAEQRLGARREADEGMAGRVVAVIALGLDDGAAATLVEQGAADQVAGDGVHRAVEELDPEPPLRGRGAHSRSSMTRALTAARVSVARSIWVATEAEAVPPSIFFDSSQLLRLSTS